MALCEVKLFGEQLQAMAEMPVPIWNQSTVFASRREALRTPIFYIDFNLAVLQSAEKCVAKLN